MALHYLVSQYIALHYVTLHQITPHYITSHYRKIHYSDGHSLRTQSVFHCFIHLEHHFTCRNFTLNCSKCNASNMFLVSHLEQYRNVLENMLYSASVLSVCPSLKCSNRMQLFGYNFIWDDSKRPPNKAQMVVS